MSRKCEVCDTAKGRTRRVLVEDRIVALCEEHAATVQMSGVNTIEALRGLFAEPDGQRSRVERRSPLDRRIFPARPEGRRRGDGRRTGDAG